MMIGRLLDRYKALARNNQTADMDPDRNRIYLALYQLQRSHSFIEIVLEGDEAVYQSMILSIDPEERTILIDELFPAGFIGLSGQEVHVSIRHKEGRKVQFQSIILERHNQHGAPLYVLQMPQKLDLDQRRSAYRLPLSAKWSVESSFIAPDDRAYRGKLCNVSSDGICMEIESEKVEPLQYDDLLTCVEFDFAGHNIDCELIVRNVLASSDKPQPDGRFRWRIGTEFASLLPTEKRLLEKSIMRIQRDRIRYSDEMLVRQAIA